MTELTGKQKRHLRGLGQRMQCLATVGKGGMNDAVLENLDRLLKQRELVKLRLTEEQGADRKTAAEMLAEALQADVAGVVGRTVLLYRPNPDLPAEQRISLC
jgi:RNA-binding protein